MAEARCHAAFLAQNDGLPCPAQCRGRGLSGRPDAAAFADVNVYLAGDWVGPAGTLADAAAASAEQAAALAGQSLSTDRTVPAGKSYREGVLDVRR